MVVNGTRTRTVPLPRLVLVAVTALLLLMLLALGMGLGVGATLHSVGAPIESRMNDRGSSVGASSDDVSDGVAPDDVRSLAEVEA